MRGAANGISAIISSRGSLLAKHDHYANGQGFVIADVPIRKSKTLFSRFGHWPVLTIAILIVCAAAVKRTSDATGDVTHP